MQTMQTEVSDSFVTGTERPATISAQQREQMIAAAAYRRYEQRAGTSSDPLHDWLEAEKEVDASLAATTTSGMLTKSAFVSWLSTVVAECQAQIDMLSARAKSANAEMKRKYEEQLIVVTPKYEVARNRLLELCAHSDDAWGHLRQGAAKATDEMRIAIHQAVSVFKQA